MRRGYGRGGGRRRGRGRVVVSFSRDLYDFVYTGLQTSRYATLIELQMSKNDNETKDVDVDVDIFGFIVILTHLQLDQGRITTCL